jgi:hypothetical protein
MRQNLYADRVIDYPCSLLLGAILLGFLIDTTLFICSYCLSQSVVRSLVPPFATDLLLSVSHHSY